MIRGKEYHEIIERIFHDVKGIYESEQLQVNCPRCQEREGLSHPDGKFNLEINTAKGVFRCWKCDNPPFSGTLGKLIRFYGTQEDYDQYKTFNIGSYKYKYFSDEDNEEYFDNVIVLLPKEFISFEEMNINNPLHREPYIYLIADRKLPREYLFKYNLGFALYGKYKNRIIFPSYDKNGRLNYFISRTYKKIKPLYLNPDINKDNIIFNEWYINWDATIYLVEGIFDYYSLPINTIPLLGKTIGNKLFYALKNKKPNIVILLDPDAYGNAINIYMMLQAIYGINNAEKIKIVKINDKRDIDEIRRDNGEKIIPEIIKSARNLTTNDYFIKQKYEKRKKYWHYYKRYTK